MDELILEAGFWGSNVPTLGVSKYENFHIVVDDGDMGMPKARKPYRVGIYRAYEDYNGEEGIYYFEGDFFSLLDVTEQIKQVVAAIKTVEKLVEKLGNGFHPDSFIGDYIDQNNEPSFSEEECKTLQVELDEANEIFGEKIYDILKFIDHEREEKEN